MGFPVVRGRRLRQTAGLRRMVAETTLDPGDFIYPLFIRSGQGRKEEVASMPGVYRLSPDLAVEEAAEAHANGVPAVILFGIPDYKDDVGSSGWQEDGPVQVAVAALKRALPELVVLTDVCLCDYTDHGHCGVVERNRVLNDPTLPLLANIALSHARAGADGVAPSDMMDGRVAAIRQTLDREGFTDTLIMSYAAKYASAMYGPFREAAQSAPSFGDRRSYQMDPPNVREALREVEQDLAEGADLVMVKPALAYLDVIRQVRERFFVPVVAYNVSGEYSMVKAAARFGWLDERRVVLEVLLAMKRAGADLIITYHAMEAAKWLREGCPSKLRL
ncbi:MAG: porphobilinogen synthase [Bacillota bacterium]|nr:porphobilinogen synthase [Bacillota bacterium]